MAKLICGKQGSGDITECHIQPLLDPLLNDLACS